jgi:hypothetical protein
MVMKKMTMVMPAVASPPPPRDHGHEKMTMTTT